MAKFIGCCLIILCCCVCGFAQETSETDDELWPEAQLNIQLNPKFRLFFLGRFPQSKEVENRTNSQIGAHLDYIPNEYLTFRTGYRRHFSLSEDGSSSESRIVAEQTVRLPLPAKALMIFRNRQDLRFIDGDFSARFRQRFLVERDYEACGYKITPYTSVEFFYDTRFDAWNRTRSAFGFITHVTEQISVDSYYMRQNDSRSPPNHINIAGLRLIFSY